MEELQALSSHAVTAGIVRPRPPWPCPLEADMSVRRTRPVTGVAEVSPKLFQLPVHIHGHVRERCVRELLGGTCVLAPVTRHLVQHWQQLETVACVTVNAHLLWDVVGHALHSGLPR